jgi:hypothetical protein
VNSRPRAVQTVKVDHYSQHDPDKFTQYIFSLLEMLEQALLENKITAKDLPKSLGSID